MLRSTARGIPRFSITSDPLSSSIRRSRLPRLVRARRADTTIVPVLPVLEVMGINSPFQLSELYSSFEVQSMVIGSCTYVLQHACAAYSARVSRWALRRDWGANGEPIP